MKKADRPRRFAPSLLLVALLLGGLAPGARAQDADTAALSRVAGAILAWNGQNPGDLFKAVKQANPDKSAIVSMRELNKALADKRMPAPIAEKAAAIIQTQKAAQESVRSKVLSARDTTYSRYRSNNPEAFRSVYGNGDIGSWPTAAAPDASMDIDWTVFGTDPNVTAALRDECKADLLRELAGDGSGLTLADFDVVITAEGHEVAAGVFESEGGIDWAKRNMKRVTIVQPDGATRIYSLGAGDPVGEMAQAEHMAKFRDLASKGGDYEKLFDARGFLKSQIFDDPNNTAAQALWNKYMDSLSDFGIDYYRSRSSTATGGCLDMAKHLQEEVITKKHAPAAKLKKTLKYVSRADNISRGVPGLDKILASDPLLSDPAYRDVVDLARTVLGASEVQVNAIIQERFGDMPDAGLQELGNKARRAILRMSEVAFQAEMDRIILEIPDKGARKSALDKLTDDFRIVAEEGGEYGELSRGAVEQIAKVQEANDTGTIDRIRENYRSLEKIRQADQGLVSSAVEFLKQTELGGKMLEVGGKVLEIGKKPVVNFAEGKYRSASVDFVVEIADASRAKGLKAVELLGSATMWAEVLDSVRKSGSNAELAIALGKTLINNTFFGMVLNTAYAGIVQGDNNALAKAVMYMLVPETALPALVEALGNTAINLGAQTLFDAQMDNVYKASIFTAGQITDFGSLGLAGADGAKYFVDAMCDGAPEEVAQAMIGRSKPTETAKGLNAFAVQAVAKSIRSTVDNGTLLIYREDGGLAKAAAAIRRITEDITDCAKAWGVEIALSASSAGDLPGGLDKGQTRALVKLMEERERSRGEARKALVEAIVRTFLERNRAEASLDGGKAKDEYNALLQIFKDLGISKEGQASLDAEGAPYNLITSWTTSTREKQVIAVKAVQRFKDAYTTVLQARTRAEEAARSNLGEGNTPAPRPLTGSLPLTAKPEIDLQIAGAYLSEAGQIHDSTLSALELIKQAKLEGPYDTDMFKRLYKVRLRIAYQSAMMKAASEAQQLHWAVEIFDKQALFNKHSEAAANASGLQKEDTALQDEFRNHYAVPGEFIVELTGPVQIKSGEEARLVATVKIRPKQGAPGPVPPDIAQQFRYVWRSGKASLGEGPEPARSYRLDTVGTHEFTVAVKQTLTQAGKTVEKAIGERPWTVKVVAPPAEKPPAETKKPADKAPVEKPPVSPPPPVTPPGAPPAGTKGVASRVTLNVPAMVVAGDPIAITAAVPPELAARVRKYVWRFDYASIDDATTENGHTFIETAVPSVAFKSYHPHRPDPYASQADFAISLELIGLDPAYPTRNDLTIGSVERTLIPIKQAGISVDTTWERKGDYRGFSLTRKQVIKKWGNGAVWIDGGMRVDIDSTTPYAEPGEALTLGNYKGTWTKKYDSNDPPSGTVKALLFYNTNRVTISGQVRGSNGVPRSETAASAFMDAETKKAYDEMLGIVQGLKIESSGSPIPANKAPTGASPASAVPLSVKVSSDKPAPMLGDTVTLTAAAAGGTAPYTYAWTGAAKGASTALPFTLTKTGRNDFTVTVTDAKGEKASAAASVEAKALSATISLVGGGPRIPLGQTLSFQALVSAPGGAAPPAGLVYQWQPNPEVAFAPFESTKNATTGRFSKMGPVKVWVEVLQKSGTVLSTVAESDQLEIEVVAPEIALRSTPAEPRPGQEVRITASEKPAVRDEFISFWWEYSGNAINPGALADPRVYTYKPKDLAPVTVTIHGKAKDGGDDLGQKSITITAKPYEVKISEPRLMGPPPRVWNEQAKGLVEVPRAIATFQDFFVSASVSPAPPDPALRYEWKSQPEGCSISSPGSQETRGNASQAGTFNLSVTVRDNQGVTLGSGGCTVSVVAPTPEPKKAEPVKPPSKTAEALAKLKEASALAADGKLDEAIAVAEQAAALDPSSRPISSYLQQLKAAKAQKLNQQQQNKPATPSPTAPPPSKTDAAAPSKASEAAAKVKQAGVLFQQNKIAEALALSEEALQLDPNNTDAGRYVQTCRNILLADQKLKQARDLNSQSKTDEALALSEEAHRLDPDNTLAVTYIQILQSTKHLKLAVSLGNAGQLEEAAAEIAEAKKIWPGNDKIPANEQWIQELITQRDANKAIAEKKKAEAASLQAANPAATQHLSQALSLGKAGRLDEADAEVAAAKKIDPSHPEIPKYETWLQQLRQRQDEANAAAQVKKAELANQQAAQQAAIQAATQHLDKALSLGKAGQIDEAAAEVAEAKKVGPGHSKIPDFERWIAQLRQQQAAADAAAQAKKAEQANQQPAPKPAAKTPPAANKPQGSLELAGTQWEGTASITAEGATVSWPFRISIDGSNITGEMTFSFPGIEGSQKLDMHGLYNSARNAFTMTVSHQEEGVSMELALGGAAKSATQADGTLTMKVQMQGLPDSLINGTWRLSRK